MSAAPSRLQPFYCPYCGETDIRPTDEPGGYHCEVCDRTWQLSPRPARARAATTTEDL